MQKVLWALTMIGSFIGIALISITMRTAESAPQQAAGAAFAIAAAVIPYCLARAASELDKLSETH